MEESYISAHTHVTDTWLAIIPDRQLCGHLRGHLFKDQGAQTGKPINPGQGHKGCLGSVDSRSLAAFKAQDDNRKLQMELGGMCIQYGLSKRDMMKLDQVKKYGKESILDYVIDHHMTMKSCKKIYTASTAFDAVSALRSMKGE